MRLGALGSFFFFFFFFLRGASESESESESLGGVVVLHRGLVVVPHGTAAATGLTANAAVGPASTVLCLIWNGITHGEEVLTVRGGQTGRFKSYQPEKSVGKNPKKKRKEKPVDLTSAYLAF